MLQHWKRGILVNSTVKSIMVWACIIAFGMVLISWVTKGASMGGKDTELAYSDLFSKVKQGLVKDAEIQGNELHGHLKATPKEQFHTYVGDHYDDLEKAMLDAGVYFPKKEPQSNNILVQALISIGPLVLLVVLFMFFMRQMQSGGNKAMSFGKS